jgi:hypothetical protein
MDCGGLDGALAPTSEALFTKEFCGLLVSLEAAYPGSSKEIACILSEKAIGGENQESEGISEEQK